MQTLQDPILQLSWVCTRLSNPKSGVDLSLFNDLFNKIASNNQHAHNGLLQSVKVPLPLLPAGCFAAAGIYLCTISFILARATSVEMKPL
jgi:hypothetical protein